MQGRIELAKILAVTNQKGGVGKTTTAVNLSACLAALGQRVLMIDLDPQGNATTGCGVVKREALPTVYQILIGRSTLIDARIKTDFGFDVLPANRELAGAEVELIEMGGREFRLRDALAPVLDEYDFILMDCPPALNMLTVNGLVAAEAVMIPMQCEYYALEGLTDLVATLKKVRANLNSRLEIEGLLRTLFDPRSTLTQQGLRRTRRALWQQGLSHHHPAQRPSGRGAVVRQAGDCLRPFVEGCAGLHGAGAGDAGSM